MASTSTATLDLVTELLTKAQEHRAESTDTLKAMLGDRALVERTLDIGEEGLLDVLEAVLLLLRVRRRSMVRRFPLE